MARTRARIRLLFDELASPKVARALAALDIQVAHVHGEGQPPKGSEDAVVLDAAQQQKRTIVTNNHDMIALCAERGHSVIWLDPRDKDMTFLAQTLMCFTQILEWERLLTNAGTPVCIQAQKTTCRELALDRAKRLAIQRGKRGRAERRRIRKATALGGLLNDDEGSRTTSN